MKQLFLTLAFLVTSKVAWADGLIYQLPPDGSWAQFSVKTVATCEYELPDGLKLQSGVDLATKVESESRLTLGSVGQENIEGQECRWIEVAIEPTKKQEGVYDLILLKMLIPVKHLVHGE